MKSSAVKPIYTQNRELSWLKFNERVLMKSYDSTIPLMERLNFLAIFSNNLDEFFMVRVGALLDMNIIEPQHLDSKSHLTSLQQLNKIYPQVQRLIELRDEIYKSLNSHPQLFEYKQVQLSDLTKEQRNIVIKQFTNHIFPLIHSQVLDSHHPFPNVHSKQLCVLLALQRKNKSTYGLISIPTNIPRIIPTGFHQQYILVEELVNEYASSFFEHYIVNEKVEFCLTRSTDLHFDDEIDLLNTDFRMGMKKLIKKRLRMSVVRLELKDAISDVSRNFLLSHTKINESQVFITSTPLECRHLFKVISKYERAVPEMYYQPHTPALRPAKLTNIQRIFKQDLLLFYPFEHINSFVDLLHEAAQDKRVTSIKITFYRISNPSKIVEALVLAAENNKQVTVVMELKARFDELNNIDYSVVLEDAGCHICYGFEDLKVHSKLCLISFSNNQYITQVGTGNYNESTSKKYTDYCYITSNVVIAHDAMEVFDSIIKGVEQIKTNLLLVSPTTLKPKVLQLIDEQIALKENGYIFFKLNSLTDRAVIDKLIEASQANVKIQLIVRGICCLLPKVKGYSDNIEVHSLVGRFLEHSRIYCFGQKAEKLYISSADMMTRNTERRIEVACPILDTQVRSAIIHHMEVLWNDNINGTQLMSDGLYYPISSSINIDSQNQFIEEAQFQIHQDTHIPITLFERFKRLFFEK